MELTMAADSPVELVLAGHVHLYDSGVIDTDLQLRQIVGGAAYEGRAVLIKVTGRSSE